MRAGKRFNLKSCLLKSHEILYKTAPEVWDGGLQAGVSGWWVWARCSSRCPTCWQTRTAPPRGPAGTRPHPSATWPSHAASRRGWVVVVHSSEYTQCCGCVTFWCGSGSADPYHWLTDQGPAPVPGFFSVADKMPTKIFFIFKIF
jgi:hypothetical protein